jgi:hypothetical protein
MPLTLDGTNGITQSTSFKSNTYLDAAGGNTATVNGTLIPASGVTLVSTAATQTLTNKSIAASQLTGALPAIDGSALTGIVTGGMTLLGTLTTTSGTSVTLSGLTLTSYKQLLAVFKLVGSNVTSGIILSSGIGLTITDNGGTSAGICGTMLYDLTNGILVTNASASINAASTNQAVIGSAYAAVTNSSITTASTSITFSSAGTFNKGSILIYGVK